MYEREGMNREGGKEEIERVRRNNGKMKVMKYNHNYIYAREYILISLNASMV